MKGVLISGALGHDNIQFGRVLTSSTIGWFSRALTPSTQIPRIRICHQPSAPCTLLHFHSVDESAASASISVAVLDTTIPSRFISGVRERSSSVSIAASRSDGVEVPPMLNIPSLPFTKTSDQTGLSMISFSISCVIKETVFVWLKAVDGARPKYAPEGKRVRIHCFAGLQSAKEMGMDRLIVGR
jgi:hypothetical protein